jgi:ABC-type Fe3+ transport system substrate-binding protein
MVRIAIARRALLTICVSACVGAGWHGARAADAALVEAARKEGRVTWYTSSVVDQLVRPAAEAFEKLYGIKVTYVRADGAQGALRVLNEGQAGQMQADAFDGFGAPALIKAGLVLKWQPDSIAHFPKQFYDANGYWTATFQIVLTPGFNSDLVPRGTEPKTLQDLLDPKLKGKIVWDSRASNSGASGFVGLILREMGEENGQKYLRELAKQEIAGLHSSARQVLDLVVAGEYAVALQIFNHHARISAKQGAPVAWIPMQPALGVMSVISVTKDAPHPNAGKLLVDFLASKEGQTVYRNADYMPVDPAVEPNDPSLRPDGVKFKAIYMTPEETDELMPHWSDVYKDIFK